MREQLKDNNWQGAALLNIGQIYLRSGDYQNALLYLRQAYADYRLAVKPVNQNMVLYEMARHHLKLQQPGSAKPNLHYALQLIPEDRTSHISKIYNNLGATAFWEMEYPLRHYYLKALQFVGHSDLRKYAIAYNNVGEAYLLEGRITEARRWLERSLALKRQIKRPTSTLITLTLLAKVHSQQGNTELAMDLLSHGLKGVKRDDISTATLDALDLAAKLADKHPEVSANNYLVALNERVHSLQDQRESFAELKSRYDLQQYLSQRQQAKIKETITHWGTIAVLFVALIIVTMSLITKEFIDYKRQTKLGLIQDLKERDGQILNKGLMAGVLDEMVNRIDGMVDKIKRERGGDSLPN